MEIGVVPYINRADARLGFTNGAGPAGYAGSWEQIALVSLAYNGLGAWPSALTQAIKAGDRAEAWYQIRYKSNSVGSKYSQGIALTDVAGTTKDEQGNFDQGFDKGWAKRRFAESELFGLYDNPSNVTVAEAREVLQTIQEHRAQIIAYEKAYGFSPDGSAGTRGNQVAAAASNYSMLVGTKTLTESLNPAKTIFLNDLRASNPELADKLQDAQWLSTNIYVAGDNGGTMDTLPYQTGSSAGGAADLMVGGAGNDTLKGNKGDDVLIGNGGSDVLEGAEGDDVLVGGAGNDTLKGGAGNDIYRFKTGEGRDTIEDSDDQGQILLDGAALGFFKGAAERGTYRLDPADGPTIWLTVRGDGSATIVKGTDTNNAITIKNFDLAKAQGGQGYMGIRVEPAKVALTQGGGNFWSNLAADLSTLAGKETAVAEGGGVRFVVSLSAGAKAGETITLALGALGDKFKAILGDTTVDANGAVITLAEGQTQVSFALVQEGELDADGVSSLSVSYSGNGQSATSNTWQINLRDSGEAEGTFNGDYVVQAEKNTGLPIKRYNTAGQEVTVVDTDKLYYVIDGQGNLKAGSNQPTQRPIYNEQGEVIGMEDVPSNDKMVTDNTLYGTGGNDKINGLTGNDLLGGMAGNDVIKGGDGSDYISSSADVGATNQQRGPDDQWVNWGLPGGKALRGGGAMWGVYPGDGEVVIWSGIGPTATDAQSDVIDAGAGDDWVMASWGHDRVKGGDGKDQIDGLAGDDVLEGDAGDDILNGDGLLKSGYLNSVSGASHGSDFLDGGAGNKRRSFQQLLRRSLSCFRRTLATSCFDRKFQQAGFAASQAKQAAAVYANVLQAYGADAAGSNISFTGHSLGGGLASIMSIWFNRPATVFDPAPFQSTAESGFTVNSVIASLGAFVPSAIRDYIPAEHFANREANVQSYYAVGEFLQVGRTVANTVYAANTPIQFGNADVGAFAMHPQTFPLAKEQPKGCHV